MCKNDLSQPEKTAGKFTQADLGIALYHVIKLFLICCNINLFLTR